MNVLAKVERYLRRSGQNPTRFGRNVANDPGLVSDLRRGRAIGARLAARIDAFLEAGQ